RFEVLCRHFLHEAGRADELRRSERARLQVLHGIEFVERNQPLVQGEEGRPGVRWIFTLEGDRRDAGGLYLFTQSHELGPSSGRFPSVVPEELAIVPCHPDAEIARHGVTLSLIGEVREDAGNQCTSPRLARQSVRG